MPRRHLENAYLEAPFFRQSYATAFLAPTIVSVGIIIFLGSFIVYGFGVFIHAAAIFLTAFLLVPILKISQKTHFFKTSWWVGELLILSALLPVNLSWYVGVFTSMFYLLMARVFLSANRRLLFNPIALTFLITILIFPSESLYQTTVFAQMKSISLGEWLNASLTLMQGIGEPSTTLLVGNSPGGSILVVIFCGVILALTHVISFSFAVIYTILCLIALLSSVIKTQQLIFSPSDLLYIQNVFFAGVFFLREPTPLEFSRKWTHLFLCVAITTLAFVFEAPAPWCYGILFANIFLPLIEITPSRKIFGHQYSHERPSFRPQLQIKELALFFLVSLCLIATVFFFKELL
ncbi:MAG: RnfABCDGE type electron transport complex subunit D [Brevinema sp.]